MDDAEDINKERKYKYLTFIPSDANLHQAYENLLMHQEELRAQNEELILTRKEAESSQKLYKSLFDNAPVGFLIMDREGIIQKANKAAEKLLTGKSPSLENLRFQKFLVSESKDIFHTFLRRIFQKFPLQQQEFKIIGANEKTMEVRIEGIINEDLSTCLITVSDISIYRTAEKLLQKTLADQERLVITHKVQEEERARISEAIHNGIAQYLYALQLTVEKIKKAEDFEKSVERIKEIIAPCIIEARTIAFELMPSILKDFGLKETITALCKKKSRPGLDFKCAFQGPRKRFDEQTEIAIYRIIQELLNNIDKHSQGSKGKVAVQVATNFVLVEVSDNGQGFDLHELNKKSMKMGLRSIRNRVQLLNGNIDLSSPQGHGTKVVIHIPVKGDY